MPASAEKNGIVKVPDQYPAAGAGTGAISRRALLLMAGTIPVIPLLSGVVAAAIPARPQHDIIIRNGWILRTEDLHRLPPK